MDIDDVGIGIPIFEETMKKFENLSFMRDSYGRWQNHEASAGWYQNSSGDLFHYDGVVWDTVPSESVRNLEFLGGK
jgi:hypothetical protein